MNEYNDDSLTLSHVWQSCGSDNCFFTSYSLANRKAGSSEAGSSEAGQNSVVKSEGGLCPAVELGWLRMMMTA